MATQSRLSAPVAGALLACLLAATLDAVAADAPAGERWRITTSMEMMGMKMPGRTSEICKEASAPPVAAEKNCQMTESTRSGNTIRFRMHCTGENAAEVDGTSTLIGPDHSRTVMHMKMAQGEMTMNSEGEKLGACTGSESNLVAKKEAAKMQAMGARVQAEAQQAQAKSCADAARTADSPYLMTQMCKDPETVKTYCANFQTHKAFRKQAEEEARTARAGVAVPSGAEAHMQPMSTSAKLCGVDARQLRTRLCSTAEAQGQFGFIASQCPVLAKVIAQRECAGRSYTTISARYRDICASLAQPSEDDGAQAPAEAPQQAPQQAPKQEKPNPLSKGKKILGGLLGN
ncbi:MAG: DUF3617 family protein [Steroidobacteraceae bacterium]